MKKDSPEEDEDSFEISDKEITPSKLIETKKKLEEEVEIKTHEKKTKPSRPVTTTKTKTTSSRSKKTFDYVEGVCDYKKLGLNESIVNNLIEAINDAYEFHDIDEIPKMYLEGLRHYNITHPKYRLIGAKLSSHTIALKIECVSRDDDKSRSMPIKKFGLKNTTSVMAIKNIKDGDIPVEMMRILKAFLAYDAMFDEPEKTIWTPKIEEILDTDMIYKFSAMKTEGVMDTTRNIPLGPFRYYFNPEASKEYKYRAIDYQILFSYLRFGGKSFSKTTLDSAMKNIYKYRTAIIYHDAVKDKLEGYWEEAREEIDACKDENKVVKVWRSILHSEQCKNIILRGYPATSAFEDMMKKLLSNLDTKLMMASEMWSICFIFSPFAVMLKSKPATDAKFHKQAMNMAVEQATLECLDYAECRWAKAIIDGIDPESELCLLEYLKVPDNHIFEPAGKGDKNSEEEESDQ